MRISQALGGFRAKYVVGECLVDRIARIREERIGRIY